jgi:soluble lytic murein transglycosylase-like protein
MNTDHHHCLLSFSKDVALFLVTVGIGMFFLSAVCGFSNATECLNDTPLTLARPQPPPALALAPEPVPALPVFSENDNNDKAVAENLPSASDEDESQDPIPYHEIIVQAAGRYEVDPNLIRAIILAESGNNPKAKSKRGARGLMQLMPSTAKALGVSDIFDPEENIDGGVRYFRSLLDRFDGDVRLALAAYNAGYRYVLTYDGVPPFKATKRYIKKVLKFLEQFKAENTDASHGMA